MMITMMTNNYDEQATPQSLFQQVKIAQKFKSKAESRSRELPACLHEHEL